MRPRFPVVALVTLTGCWLSDSEIGRKYLDPDSVTEDTGSPKTEDIEPDSDTDTDSDTDSDTDTDTDTDAFACADGDLGSAVGTAVASGSTVYATDDHGPFCGANLGGTDLAWTWTAPSDGCWQIDTSDATFDTVLAVVDRCGGNELVCNDDIDLIGGATTSETGVWLPGGQQVLVVVDGFDGTESGPVTVDFLGTTQIIPDVQLGGATSGAGNSAGADTTTDPPLCVEPSGADVYVEWTATQSGLWLFDTAGSDYDTVLSVERPCTSGPIVCADIVGDGGEEVDVWLVDGETVLVRIGGWNGLTGNWQLGINLSP